MSDFKISAARSFAGDDFEHLSKSGGWQPIPGGKKGGFRKKVGGKWQYYYPHPDGKPGKKVTRGSEKSGDPTQTDPQPKSGPRDSHATVRLHTKETAGSPWEVREVPFVHAKRLHDKGGFHRARILGDFDEVLFDSKDLEPVSKPTPYRDLKPDAYEAEGAAFRKKYLESIYGKKMGKSEMMMDEFEQLLSKSEALIGKKSSGGWQNIPGGKKGGQRKRVGGKWQYRYDVPDYKMSVTGDSDDAGEAAEKLKAGIEKSADICKVSPPVCKGNLGIERKDMPQFDDSTNPKVVEEYLQEFRDEGVKVESTRMAVGQLKATQKEIQAGKVAGMAAAHERYVERERTGGPKISEGPDANTWSPGKGAIVVSKDGYVLDGHHRWAAMMAHDPANTMPVFRVDASIKELLAKSEKFHREGRGVKKADFNAASIGVKKSMTAGQAYATGKWFERISKAIADADEAMAEGQPMDEFDHLLKANGGARETQQVSKAQRFDPVEVDTLSKGMSEFHIPPGSGTPALPESYLEGYIDAFIEEAYEHEYGEAAHRSPRLEGSKNPSAFLAQAIFNELLIFAVHNKNLLRGLKKFKIMDSSYIAERLTKLGLCRVDSENYSAEHDARVGGYHPEKVEGLSMESPPGYKKSLDAQFAATVRDEQAFKLRGGNVLRDGKEQLVLRDDGVDPFVALKKSIESRPDALGRHFVVDQGSAAPTVDGKCPIHGFADMTKSMNLNNPYVSCTCPSKG